MFKIKLHMPTSWEAPSVLSWDLKKEKPATAFTIKQFTASEEELAHIYRRFRNIPSMLAKTEVTWRGDIAQFIYDNL